MTLYEARIQELAGYVDSLLSQPKQNFTTGNAPRNPGIYTIFNEEGVLLYVGKTSNLRRRIFSNHRSGNTRGSAFRKSLMELKQEREEKFLSSYILEKCTFQYLTLEKEKISSVEHFAIAVLEPTLNK